MESVEYCYFVRTVKPLTRNRGPWSCGLRHDSKKILEITEAKTKQYSTLTSITLTTDSVNNGYFEM